MARQSPSRPHGEEGRAHPARIISYEELRKRLDDPSLTIVDVLPRVAYEERHIPGALSLPVGDIPARARQVLPEPGAQIAVYCGGPT